MSSDLAPSALDGLPPATSTAAPNMDNDYSSTAATTSAPPPHMDDFKAPVDEEAYEPTYEEAFPPLHTASAVAAPLATNSWHPRVSVRSSTVTQVFCVPVEERRFKEKNEQDFGGIMEQSKVCQDIMGRTGVSIETSEAKDKSLTVVVTGKLDAVMKARKMVVQQLQQQASIVILIPKEHHRFILGTKGQRLSDLELATATKISIPRMDENSDKVTVIGTKEGIETAVHELQSVSDEQAKQAYERLEIPKIYHPFINGPDNQFVKQLMEQTGAKIRVPPLSVEKNEVVVAGEKEGVKQAVETIMKIFKEKERKCQTVSVEVRKSQHKYVIGPKGSNLAEILASTGVSVEVPRVDEPSETITLRGDQEQLGTALTAVYSKANSVVVSNVEAPAWLHRFIIGRKGAKINLITAEFPKVHIGFQEGKDKIELEGPPQDVEEAEKLLKGIVKGLVESMSFEEIEVDPKYHKHIIGRQGSNITRIKEKTGVSIRIPPDNAMNTVIRIEGTPEGVQLASQELREMVLKMENEKSRDIIIEQRFHKTMIGQAGSKIREIRDRFNQVQITFPDPARKSDVVTLRGPRNDVDKCHRFLQQMQQEMVTNNYMSEVRIFKEFHKHVIGKGGSTIRKIRDETDTKIELPSENIESDVIVITGKKANVEHARAMIEDIQKDLANIQEITIEIPNKFHNSIIGAKGRLIRSVMEECGGVVIRFPPENTNSDKVLIRGPKDDIEKAKGQLLELTNERKESGFTLEVRAKVEYHRFLIGRGGGNIRQLRDQTGARVIFPTSNDPDPELITIVGKKDTAENAKKELELRIKNLENIVEMQIAVEPKYHRHFVVRRGEVLRHIADEYGGVSVSFPRSGVQSDKVTLKGAKDCVEGAKKRILEIVADLESQVTMECIIAQKYHRTVMGQKGSKVQNITSTFDVGIKFPDRPVPNQEVAPGENGEVTVNGDVDVNENTQVPCKHDIIIITGKKDKCEAAHNALLALVPVTKEVSIPMDFHRFIIGQRGREIRQMMDEHDVNISIPSPDQNSDIIQIKGAPANVVNAEEALEAKVRQLELEKQDRLARGFQVEATVPPIYHPKIIGRKGLRISKIRQDYNVLIQFPDRGSTRDDIITITGYERDAHAAKEDILAIVTELEDMLTEEVSIDHRVHSRIIGGRGRNVRKIMEQFKVDIKFPRPESKDPDIVMITGAENNVLECKDQLQNLEEEYIQDIVDSEVLQQYSSSLKKHGADEDQSGGGDGRGFVVRNAPWSSQAPDTTSNDEFPEFGVANSSAPPIMWGPRRK